MQFSIKTPLQHVTWGDVRAVWLEADQTDTFESAWVFDHLYPIVGDPHGSCLESWTTLTSLAAVTSRIRLGTMVNGMHFRHPAVTAKMAATLDLISGGRLNLGLGAGWFQTEVDEYGLDLGTVRQRSDRFEEGVEIIDRLLSEESCDFDGEYYTLENARCEPKGPQRPRPPIMIGGSGERRTLRVVARWADMWDALTIEPEAWSHKNEVLLSHCQDVGRDPAEIIRSAHIFTPPDADPQDLANRAALLQETGLDLIVFSLRAPFDPGIVGSLAQALAEI